ncbi:hypothetical protein RN02_26120 [Pseudomonas sp. PI1]|nr:hypothetical protein RN02_26120 [Pseudomonas sp. PI1]
MNAVDQQMQGRGNYSQVPVRCDVFEQLHGAASQLASGKDFRCHRRQGEVGGEHGHFQGHAARALGVDQHQVIARCQHRKQVPQPQTPVRCMQQQGVQLAAVIVGEHQVEASDDRAGYELPVFRAIEQPGRSWLGFALHGALQIR